MSRTLHTFHTTPGAAAPRAFQAGRRWAGATSFSRLRSALSGLCALCVLYLAGGPQPAGAGPAAGATPLTARDGRDGLAARMAAIAPAARGRVGAAAMVLETGEAAGLDDAGRFPMQSVYKLPIAMAVLHALDTGTLRLAQPVAVRPADVVPAGLHSPLRDSLFVPAPLPPTSPSSAVGGAAPAAPAASATPSAPAWQARRPGPGGGVEVSLRELLRYAVEESDGTASDVLLRLAGGPPAATAYLRRLGVTEMAIATSEQAMAAGPEVQYRNWATPRGAVGLLRLLQAGSGLAPASRALLLQWMTDTTTGAHRIRGLLPPGTAVAHKTGSSGTADGLTRATNDVGIVQLPGGRHLAVAVFVSDSRADEAAREGVIARIARAAWDLWSAPPAAPFRRRAAP